MFWNSEAVYYYFLLKEMTLNMPKFKGELCPPPVPALIKH